MSVHCSTSAECYGVESIEPACSQTRQTRKHQHRQTRKRTPVNKFYISTTNQQIGFIPSLCIVPHQQSTTATTASNQLARGLGKVEKTSTDKLENGHHHVDRLPNFISPQLISRLALFRLCALFHISRVLRRRLHRTSLLTDSANSKTPAPTNSKTDTITSTGYQILYLHN